LKYIPPIVIFYIAMAFAIAWIDRKWMYWFWIVSLIVVLIIGLYDFYLWEYDYGHSLDPRAPMKFEGESFQPPLIGRKEIINYSYFDATYCWLVSGGIRYNWHLCYIS
jgi:copper chaperone NosL